MAGTSSTARALLPADEAPPTGSLVDVAPHRAHVPLTARVVAVGADRLVLERPADLLGAASRLVEDEAVDLVWSEAGSVVGVPVLVRDLSDDGWTAVVTGAPQRVQRREAVRAPVDLRGRIGRAADAPGGGRVLEVVVEDLSESGARCLVDPVELRLEQDELVHLDLPLEGLPGPLAARVVHRRYRHGTRATLVGLRFEATSAADADAVRRHVFARLRELRRRGAL
ncbi:flagellar brake protein [uncultured Pseudokineococcus sp.]|uniref:flagellar brake protein n=1 Tax=uncultured Pseudokineococcus sp. TaxID=1642928 RepID=UPI00261E0A8C|nr:PilZ domain-containing protein [uncultured Pseudokineococcus sp.]